jgi:MFS family permease
MRASRAGDLLRASPARPAEPSDPDTEWAPFGSTVATLTGCGLLMISQTYLVIPLFPVLARAWDTSASAVTVIPTAFALAYGFGQLFWGPLSDRLGRRRVMSAGLAATGVLTAGIAAADSLTVAVVLAVPQGFAASSFSPGALAHLVERISPIRRAIAVSLLTTSFFAAGVVGQVLSQGVEALFGWRAVFLLVGGALLCAAARVLYALEGASTGHQTDLRSAFAAIGTLMRSQVMVRVLLASMTILGSFVGLYAALTLMGPGDLSDGGSSVGWLRVSGLPALVAVPFLVRSLRGRDPGLRAAGGFLVAAAALALLIAAGDDLVVIGAVMSVFVLAIASTSPALAEVIGRETGAARGAAMGVWGLFVMLGASGGPQLARLLHPVGFDAVLLTLTGLLVLAAGLVGTRPVRLAPEERAAAV